MSIKAGAYMAIVFPLYYIFFAILYLLSQLHSCIIDCPDLELWIFVHGTIVSVCLLSTPPAHQRHVYVSFSSFSQPLMLFFGIPLIPLRILHHGALLGLIPEVEDTIFPFYVDRILSE